ncbi:MAG: DNA repair protein RecN, partial [Thermodesulfobacteriota bacterium]
MLREIAIKNFAIIEDLRIGFSDGLSILSGETGAGKSIIITALNTLLGSRADASMIRNGADTAELEALFELDPEGPAAAILLEQGHEQTDELIIRRVLSANNRHKVYINGRLATMQGLNAITENLAGISGQHEHQRLLKESEHMRILDQFGGLTDLREKVNRCYHDILPLIKRLDEQHAARSDQAERMELLRFQKSEIEDAAIEPEEDEHLKQELSRLKHAQTLYQSVGESVEALYNREGAIADQLAEVKKRIETAAGIDPALHASAEALADASFRIEDTAENLRTYMDTIEFDPQRAETIEARLDTLNRLKRKYGGSIESVGQHLAEVDAQLSEVENLSESIEKTEAELERLHGELTELAGELSRKRRDAGQHLAEKMEAELRSLNMPDTRFAVTFRHTEAQPDTPGHLCADGKAISGAGLEQAVFMIAPNVGESLKPLSRIASGGELSRVILALKAILVDTEPMDTVVFDEVDAGIGGQTADVVGQKLAALADHNQVICITHLAQIAKFGRRHFKIEKQVADGRTSTRIISLDETERIEETARMIGGTSITDTT